MTDGIIYFTLQSEEFTLEKLNHSSGGYDLPSNPSISTSHKHKSSMLLCVFGYATVRIYYEELILAKSQLNVKWFMFGYI